MADHASAAPPTLLLVEDSPTMARLYRRFVRHEPYAVVHAASAAEAAAALGRLTPAVALIDLRLPDADGLGLLRQIRADGLPTVAVAMTAHGSIELAVEAMRIGAFDFLVKPFARDRLLVTLRNAFDRFRLTGLVERYRAEFGRDRLCGLLGGSDAMQAVYHTILAAARSRAAVFISGASGTGKELAARAVHELSERRGRPFVAVNCAALPASLAESELFGHRKGAFTGADAARAGAAASADGGTLFLDEISEMEIATQAKLLRFLQGGRFTPLGADREQVVDVRVLAASNRRPEQAMAEGCLREDLFYRLNVIPLELPSLKEREADALQIAQALLARVARAEGKRFGAMAPDAEACLLAYDWPGNVRELENSIHRAVVLNDGELLTAAMLPPALRAATLPPAPGVAVPPVPASPPGIRPLIEVERAAIEAALAACRGNVARAATLLGINPSTLYRKRQAWEAGAAPPAASAAR